MEVLDWIAHHQKMGENQSTSMSKLTLNIIRTKSEKRLVDWKVDWVAGIDKFYVHDDYSTQPLLELLLNKVALGEVHYKFWASEDTSGHGRQMETYEHCLASHGHRHKVGLAQEFDDIYTPTLQRVLSALRSKIQLQLKPSAAHFPDMSQSLCCSGWRFSMRMR